MAKARPNSGSYSNAYLAASSAYYAGFRGFPLTVMTAIAGRESSWNPWASNTADPAGGSYGLWQINGSHNQGGVATSSWISEMKNPLNNAQQAWATAGGNSLSGVCGAWYTNPSSGQSCGPGSYNPQYGIAYLAHLPQAQQAAAQVQGPQGPAPKAVILNPGSWGASGGQFGPTGPGVGTGGTSQGAGNEPAGPGGVGCNRTKTDHCNQNAPGNCVFCLQGFFGGCIINRCQLKAIGGGALLTVGIAGMSLSAALLIVAVVGEKSGIIGALSGIATKGVGTVANVQQSATRASQARATRREIPERESLRTQKMRNEVTNQERRHVASARRQQPRRSEHLGRNNERVRSTTRPDEPDF